MARLRIHRRTAPPRRGTLWPRPWKRRARSRRVLRHRIEKSESPRNGWRCPLVCRIALRIGADQLKRASPRNRRIDPITSRGIPRFRSVEMEIAVVLAQANGNSEQIGELLLGKDSRLGSVREDAPFAQKDHTLNFGT